MAIQVWDGTKYVGAELGRFGGLGTLTEALVWDGTQYVKVWPVGGGALWSDDFDTSDATLWDNAAFGGVHPWHNNGETVNMDLALLGLKPVPAGVRVDVTLGSGTTDEAALLFGLASPDFSELAALTLSSFGLHIGFEGDTANLRPSALEPGDVLSLVREGGWISVLVNDEPAPNNDGLSSEPLLRVLDPIAGDAIVVTQQFPSGVPSPTISRVQVVAL